MTKKYTGYPDDSHLLEREMDKILRPFVEKNKLQLEQFEQHFSIRLTKKSAKSRRKSGGRRLQSVSR